MNITEYAPLKDSRPEFSGGFNNLPQENTKIIKNVIKVNENKFINMSLSDIFDKMINILPNMYNDYYKKYLETKNKLRIIDPNISESNIYMETMKSFIFHNENLIYLGILILIIVFFLYIIN